MNAFIEELKQRGLVSQMTDEQKISTLLDNGVSLYCGFDPTADSLHVGSLLPLITMLRFKKAGHTVFPLIGGATGMIGDPSFKAQERTLNDEATVHKFKEGISAQIKSILGDVELVDNHTWTSQMSIIDFLRDVGKHFSVNAMMSKDSVRSRLEREDQGISFTEFSYQLLQSMDFHHLWKEKGCQLQLGGSDQWGNITAGIDLIHKREGNDVVATGLTMPLLVKSDGTKFGKSESGAVWLSADKTSPFDFFQFWLKVADADIPKFFKMLSFRSVEEIDRILAEDSQRDKPMAQQLLAEELTALIHGEEALNSVITADDYDIRTSRFGVSRIYTKDSKVFRAVVDMLTKQNCEFWHHQLREDTPFRLVIRDIHPNVPKQLIDRTFTEKGHTVMNIYYPRKPDWRNIEINEDDDECCRHSAI